MPSHYDQGAAVTTPSTDRNIQTPAAQATGTANPPIPEDHSQQTPEFLQSLISELNTLRNEQSALFAKMYAPHPVISHESPHTPPYEAMEEYHRQGREFDYKISALKMQIQELRVLIALPPEALPKPELKKEEGPAQPATDVAGQSELAKGPSFPVQRQSGGGEPIQVNPGLDSDSKVKTGGQLGKGY